MTTGTAHDKLRQIAILISCVDAAAARQLLLHLPTDKAKQVRTLAGQLGTISAEEKRRILAEFQRSAAAPRSPTSQVSPAGVRGNATDTNSLPPNQTGLGQSPAATLDPEPAASETSASAWTKLSTESLVRFVRSERPAVTAVVISQLPPQTAVAVLQHLPADVSHDVLQRLSRLQEIDPEAMQAIDEHLSQRLGEYQHHLQSELENSRRMQALLAAAPAQLRQQWTQVLSDTPAASSLQSSIGDASTMPSQPSMLAAPTSAEADVLDIGDAGPQTADEGQSKGDILAFPPSKQNQATTQAQEFDRSLIQFEFEQILELPPHTLAMLLSSTDSQTVLLALAGATPDFMHRFCNMLDRNDAKALQRRLQQIGAIQLRDVDEAQRQIVENAAAIGRPQSSASHRTARRAA